MLCFTRRWLAAAAAASSDAKQHIANSAGSIGSSSGHNATTTSSSTLATPSPLVPDIIEDLNVRAYFENPIIGLGVHHFAQGRVVERLSEDEYIVDMDDVHLSPVVEVSARVQLMIGRTEHNSGRIAGGIVGRINSDGTFGVLLKNNTFLPRVSPSDIYLLEGRSRTTLSPEYLAMMEWFKDAGVRRHADCERICAMLYQRGWREPDLYLLEGPDIHCMTYVKKSVRMVVLEKAEWQRMHHAEMRTLLRERVKERDWRYFVQKFSGFVSANWAGLGVLSVFLWNYKNYRRQQRDFQKKHAVNTLTQSGNQLRDARQSFVERTMEENWGRQILRQLDVTRPRIAVLTGYSGCGKSTLFREAVRKENKPALFVEVRGGEDTLACMVKSMKVPSLEACGDYLDFITDAFQKATKINGEPPIVVVALREGSQLARVYNETVVLACDRMLCHLVIEVPMESLDVSNVTLPRVDFFHVPNFTAHQAFQYTQHGLDPVAMSHFIDVVGTNTNDVDELLAAVSHRKVPIVEYTNQKLCKAMRHVSAAWTHNPSLKATLKKLAETDFALGQHVVADPGSLSDKLLKDIVMYDAVHDRWVFKKKILHTATLCCE